MHEPSGLHVVASPPVLEWRQLSSEELRGAIDVLAKFYDKIVLDTSGSLNEVSEVALEMATIVLWVTTGEYTSVRDSLDAIRAMEALSLPKSALRFVLNAVSSEENVRVSTMQDVFQKEIFWQIPYDKRIRQGTNVGQPITISAPTSVAARNFADLASVVSGGRPNGNPPEWQRRQVADRSRTEGTAGDRARGGGGDMVIEQTGGGSNAIRRDGGPLAD